MSIRESIGVVVGVLFACVPLRASELDVLPLGDPMRANLLASALSGEIFDTRQGRPISLDELARSLDGVQVLLLGESHNDMRQKDEQARILDALATIGRTVVLGMEFFNREDTEELELWAGGELTDDELIESVGWYERGSYHFAYTKRILEAARRNGFKIAGLNVPREIVRAVNRGGLDSLNDEQRAQIGEVIVDDSPQHRYLVSRYFGDTVAQMPPAWLENMYAAQCVWDVAMARSIQSVLPEQGIVVVVVGSGHVAYDLGIARRLGELSDGKSIKVKTYCPVSAPMPDPEGMHGHPMGGGHGSSEGGSRPALFARSLADFVGVFEDPGEMEAYPRLGMTTRQGPEGEFRVGMVWPESLAKAAGLKPGDRIVDVNGRVPGDLAQLKRMLAELEWGQRLDVAVDRDGSALNVVLLLYPSVETIDRSVPEGWEIVVLGDANELPIDEPLSEPSVGSSQRSSSVLVLRNGEFQRIEVRRGKTLAEVHQLDPRRLVVRSLYKDPLPDRTVEIVYERDQTGTVRSQRRLDRCGDPVVE